MRLYGWNTLPEECLAEFSFEDGPKWLKVLALTPFFDRFAYPIAVNRGLGTLWCPDLGETDKNELESLGWKVHLRDKNDEEKFFEGSIAILTASTNHRRTPSIGFTRWGRHRAMRTYVHKTNGTLTNLKSGTLPTDS
jgi:hypothetical protein